MLISIQDSEYQELMRIKREYERLASKINDFLVSLKSDEEWFYHSEEAITEFDKTFIDNFNDALA